MLVACTRWVSSLAKCVRSSRKESITVIAPDDGPPWPTESSEGGSEHLEIGSPYLRPDKCCKIATAMGSSEYVHLARKLAEASAAQRLFGPRTSDVSLVTNQFSCQSNLTERVIGKAGTMTSRVSIASSSCEWPESEQTMILLDWDDTLIPTTWLKTRKWFRTWLRRQHSLDRMDEEDRSMLAALDIVARDFVVEASAHGKVCCVTLAVRPWQSTTMQALFPQLAQVWEKHEVEVRYAQEEVSVNLGSRSGLGGDYTEEEEMERKRTKQKQKSMQSLIKRFYKEGSWKNVVSIGDGPFERKALQDIGFHHRNPLSMRSGEEKPFRVKTVQMVMDPTCEQIGAQLQVLTSWLSSLICLDHDFDVDFNTSEQSLLNLQERLADLLEETCGSWAP